MRTDEIRADHDAAIQRLQAHADKSGYCRVKVDREDLYILLNRNSELLSECDRKDAEIAGLKDAAIRGDGYHTKYSACLKELDDKDAEIAALRKALEISVHETSSTLDALASHGTIKITKKSTEEEQLKYYIQQAREAIEHEHN